MKAKKLLALVTAVTLVVLPTSTAFAEQTNLSQTSVESTATVDYVDPTGVISIVVPTSESMNFTLDPQNLAATQGVGVWNAVSGGAILPQTVVTVVNKSAVPVKTSVAFTVNDNAATKTTLVADDSNINDGTDKKMHLTLTPATAKTELTANAIATGSAIFVTSGSAVEFTADELTAAGIDLGDATKVKTTSSAALTAEFGQFVPVDENADPVVYNQVEVGAIDSIVPATTATTVAEFIASYANTTNAVSVVSGPAHLAYIVDNAEYYVSKTGTTFSLKYRGADTNTNYDTASYIIGGSINKNANWSGYTGSTKITLGATYTFEAMTDSAANTALSSKLSGSHNSVTYVAPVAPSIGAASYEIAAATAEDVAVSLGEGSSAATGITSISYNDGSPQTLAADKYSFASNTLTFTSAYVDELIAASVTSREYTVTFNNNPATTATVTLTYTAPIAPSIAVSSAALTASSGAAFTVDLGAGSAVATDVASITYVSGSALTVDPSKYTFADNTLTFTSAYVDELIGTGVTSISKEYTVTFDNTPATTATVTLTYTAPDVAASVTPSTATFSKAVQSQADVVLSYNLGSGASKKTAVTAVHIDGPTGSFELMAAYPDYVTVTGSTVTIKKTWLAAYAASTTAKIYVCFDGAAKSSTADCTISITN